MSEKRYWMDLWGVIDSWGASTPRDNGNERTWTEVLPVVVGSKAWAAVQLVLGNKVWNDELRHTKDETEASWYRLVHGSDGLDTGWYLLPAGPQCGQIVHWWADGLDGTARYLAKTNDGDYPYEVCIGHVSLYVERVEVADD